MSDVADWWKTSIIDMVPGRIELRGQPIQDLIGNISFPDMIWMMVRGDRPSAAQSKLFEAALVSAVDHGPQAPSIAAARMAVNLWIAAEQRHGKRGEYVGGCAWRRRGTGG